jgi:heterodisulfide reductase subunit A-like polyferredoxin
MAGVASAPSALCRGIITLYDSTDVSEVAGSAGEFRVRAHRRPRFVDSETCTLCGECTVVCPIRVRDEFNEGLSERTAIHLPHAQAIPNAFLVSKLGTAPCVAACPGHLRAQGYISLIAERRYEEALKVIKQRNPFPGIVARVCDHPCEDDCLRGRVDEPVAICALEGFVADWVYSRSQGTAPGPQPVDADEVHQPATARVAIIGSGPAGLSAAHFLTLLDHPVALVDAQSEAGGQLLRIPESILPHDILQRELDEILASGVQLKLGTDIKSIDELFDEGVEAILLASETPEVQGLLSSGGEAEEACLVDPQTLATARPGVFSCGRAVGGTVSLIESIANGRRAALSIDRHLRGEPLAVMPDPEVAPLLSLSDEDIVELYQSDYVNKGPRETAIARRPVGYDVNAARAQQSLTEEQAHAEALRCLRCAICSDCGLCVEVCPTNCIDLQMRPETIDLSVGAIVVATGFTPLDPSSLTHYGYGRHKNVVTSLEYERLVGASGPTGGHLERPSDGKRVKRLGFIQCVGSRDINHNRYCSSICCMFATQEAIVANERDPEVHSTIYYMDLRAAGKGFQDCVDQAQDANQVSFKRAKVAEITEDADGCPIIWYEDTHSGHLASDAVDLVVLVTGLRPRSDIAELTEKLGIELDEYRFIKTDPYSPMDTSREGIYACGFCRGPADITESVSQASAAAARAAEQVLGG